MTQWGAFRGVRRSYRQGIVAKPGRCRQGQFHQSTKELRRCDELHVLQAGGIISDLEAHPQPRIRLDVAGVHVCDYLPDFRYQRDGQVVLEDVKGRKGGPEYRLFELKRRLVNALLGIDVEEV